MIIRMCIFIISLLSSSSIFPKMGYTGKEKVILVKSMETRHSFISYVEIKDRMYLLKQKKEIKMLLSPVREALAAYIAKALKIAHEIYIIEDTKKFPGKIKQNLPATLHTLAGQTIREQGGKYKALRLKQWWAKAKTFDDIGLTKIIINHMTWHKNLPVIVALDLITANSDRHLGNLCYDPVTDTFCAIDMDDTFNKDLCLIACKKLRLMMEDDNCIFTPEEISALTDMKQTLEFLIHKHKPKHLVKKLYYFADQAGLRKGSNLYNERVSEKLLHYKKMIMKTNKSAYKLIDLLDKIIKCKILLNNELIEENVVV